MQLLESKGDSKKNQKNLKDVGSGKKVPASELLDGNKPQAEGSRFAVLVETKESLGLKEAATDVCNAPLFVKCFYVRLFGC